MSKRRSYAPGNSRHPSSHHQVDHRRKTQKRPAVAHRARGGGREREAFNAPEDWHEPVGETRIRYILQPAGEGYRHPVTRKEVHERIALIPERFTRTLEVVQFSGMTRKRTIFPCYGMQWGSSVYLYPIEDSLVEYYAHPPKPQQRIEAEMYGGRWFQDGCEWRLEWTEKSIRDFYLNNILIHEIGHIYDNRNTTFGDRERFADWFAVEYGFRASRGRR
nr:hypothetical protein [uncultured bacterium]